MRYSLVQFSEFSLNAKNSLIQVDKQGRVCILGFTISEFSLKGYLFLVSLLGEKEENDGW
jgi:hypothetical protein